jgi:hypothetical protein
MGAFCVFGVSRTHCRKQAEKNIPTYSGAGPTRRERTASEWGGLVAAETSRLYDESIKQVRISPELDAPQFCRDWIDAAPDEVKLTKIMCRGDKIDKHDAVMMRQGAPMQTWLDYDEKAALKIPPHPPQFPFAAQLRADATTAGRQE